MNNKEKYDYWISIAEYDFETAKAMLTAKRYLYVGFMCHQVIEKSLKAIIALRGLETPKIHSLMRLADLANLIKELDETQKDFLAELNPMNVEARYISYKDKLFKILDKETCEEIINKTKELKEWIKTK